KMPGGDNPVYLAHHARALLEHNEDLDEAEQVVARLEKADLRGIATREIKARLLMKQGKTKDAVAILEACAEEPDVDIASVAAVLETLGQAHPAEKLYRRYVQCSKQPTAVLKLVGFLGRQKRWKAALDAAEPAWATCPPDAVALTCLAALMEAAE